MQRRARWWMGNGRRWRRSWGWTKRRSRARPRSRASPLQHPLQFRLLLQLRREVRHHGDGLTDLLGNLVQKDLLAVGSDVVENLRSGPVGHEGLSGAELQGAACVLYRHHKKVVSRIHVVEFFAVLPPARLQPSAGRDLPLALSAAKRHYIYFDRTGFVGHVREPAAIRGKVCKATRSEERRVGKECRSR